MSHKIGMCKLYLLDAKLVCQHRIKTPKSQTCGRLQKLTLGKPLLLPLQAELRHRPARGG